MAGEKKGPGSVWGSDVRNEVVTEEVKKKREMTETGGAEKKGSRRTYGRVKLRLTVGQPFTRTQSLNQDRWTLRIQTLTRGDHQSRGVVHMKKKGSVKAGELAE